MPGHVLGQVPVDRAAAVGQQVGKLAEGVGELPRVAHRPERPEGAARAGTAGAGTAARAGTRVAGTLPAVVFRLLGQAETERAISHRWLCGRMEGS